MAEKIKSFYDIFYRIVMFLCKLFLIADVLITSYAVLGRYVGKYVPFITDPSWSEEIVLTCMIYMAFLSAALAIHKQSHIRMTSLDGYLPKTVVQGLDLFGDVLVLVFSVIMLHRGGVYAASVGQKGFYVSLPWLSKFWLYLPVPLAGFAMILFEIEVIYKHICALLGREVKI